MVYLIFLNLELKILTQKHNSYMLIYCKYLFNMLSTVNKLFTFVYKLLKCIFLAIFKFKP